MDNVWSIPEEYFEEAMASTSVPAVKSAAEFGEHVDKETIAYAASWLKSFGIQLCFRNFNNLPYHIHPEEFNSVDQVEAYLLDPVGALAKFNHVTREHFIAWHAWSFSKSRCAANTRAGSRCRGYVPDLMPREFDPGAKYFCHVHRYQADAQHV